MAPGGSEERLLTFYLDGAHTEESMVQCGTWFASATATAAAAAAAAARELAAGGGGGSHNGSEALPPPTRIMLFNCMEEREPARLLKPLAARHHDRSLVFDSALFVPLDSGMSLKPSTGDKENMRWQHTLKGTWDALLSSSTPSSQRAPVRAAPAAPASAAAAADSAPSASSSSSSSPPPPLSDVKPSVAGVIEMLRQQTRDNPRQRLQVLVTGSLYLVGDVLRTVRRGLPV
jgi:folylpolyglutamate synthase